VAAVVVVLVVVAVADVVVRLSSRSGEASNPHSRAYRPCLAHWNKPCSEMVTHHVGDVVRGPPVVVAVGDEASHRRGEAAIQPPAPTRFAPVAMHSHLLPTHKEMSQPVVVVALVRVMEASSEAGAALCSSLEPSVLSVLVAVSPQAMPIACSIAPAAAAAVVQE